MKHAGPFPDEFGERIDVTVRKHRHHGVEMPRWEGKKRRVRSDKTGVAADAPLREAALVA